MKGHKPSLFVLEPFWTSPFPHRRRLSSFHDESIQDAVPWMDGGVAAWLHLVGLEGLRDLEALQRESQFLRDERRVCVEERGAPLLVPQIHPAEEPTTAAVVVVAAVFGEEKEELSLALGGEMHELGERQGLTKEAFAVSHLCLGDLMQRISLTRERKEGRKQRTKKPTQLCFKSMARGWSLATSSRERESSHTTRS